MKLARLIVAAAATMLATVDLVEARHARHHGVAQHAQARHHRVVRPQFRAHRVRHVRRHDLRQHRAREARQQPAQRDVAYMRTDSFVSPASASEPSAAYPHRSAARPVARAFEDLAEVVTRPIRTVGIVLGGRPSGCPFRFCGCALSLDIFGRIIPQLNLAINWARKFPRTSPAPGMVGARRGHALKLIAHVRGTIWRVWDPNSGHRRIREHERNIASFVIVNPYASSISAAAVLHAFRS